MGLSNIKKKSESLGKKSNASFLKVNKYENPKMALELISHICTSSDNINVSEHFKNYYNMVEMLRSKMHEITEKTNEEAKGKERTPNFTIDLATYFIDWLNDIASDMIIDLENNHKSILKIAVGGGYSAGKSSFLNAITNIGSLLPTGIEPVSIVNTNLNCSASVNQLSVRGRNLKKETIHLDKEVLDCIQHSSKSKVHIANVLDDILIDIPLKEQKYLDGITFIDTPGYNNSSEKNEENNTTDLETAKKAMQKADLLFWCIDIDAGTISKNDLKILKEVGEKPIVIIFTKSDKKPADEIKKIVNAAYDVCKKQLGSKTTIIDILAISCIGNKPNLQYALNKNTIEQIIKRVKAENNKTDFIKPYLSQLNELLEIEIDYSKEQIDKYKKDKEETIEGISKVSDAVTNLKEYSKTTIERLEGVLIDSYNEILESADKRIDAYNYMLNLFEEASKREDRWSEKVGFFSDASQLSKEANNAWNRAVKYVNKLNLGYNYWDEEYRKEVLKEVKDEMEELNEKRKQKLESWYEDEDWLIAKIKLQKGFYKLLEEYKPKLFSELNTSYNESVKVLEQHLAKLKTTEQINNNEIFSSISNDNYKGFLSCFSNGVDLTICNKEGFNPITYASKYGNNEMIRFFIENEVDFTIKDKNGYNALEVAAIYHYRDICDMLLSYDKNLVYESQSLVELAKNDMFIKWVSQF